MQNGRWEKIENIFNQAVSLPAENRVRFVAESCGDDEELRREIVSLLDADEKSNNFFDETGVPFVAQLLDGDFARLSRKSDFAQYKMQILLGRGGMGAVFLAQDTLLERPVALKVLPATINNHGGNIQRFQREAKAASSISHQNVAHIYEFGSHEDWYFIAMEYIAGKTLRQLLAESKIDLNQAVAAALQIAEALVAAHEAGVTHRDIKPENILVNKDNLVKVLDFGLAKLNDQRRQQVGTSFETMPGMIMGTVAYMSPEQIRGNKVDARTDLWSLGVCLYEMLEGKRPFAGETPSDVQASVLLTEPAAPRLAAELPLVEPILQRALAKNAAERYQTAADFCQDLRELRRQVYDYNQLRESESSNAEQRENSESETTAIRRAPKRIVSPKSRIWLAAAALLLLAVSLAAFWLLPNRGAAPKTMALREVMRVSENGRAVCAAISADGERIAYALENADGQALYLRTIASGDTVQLVAPSPANDFEEIGASFSPDNKFVYYGNRENGRLDGALYRVSLSGGAPERLLHEIDSPVSFSPDGSQIVFLDVNEDGERIVRANSDGSAATEIVSRRRPQLLSHVTHPAWSPDGRFIAYAAGSRTNKQEFHVTLYDVYAKSEFNLTKHPWFYVKQVGWLPGGDGLIVAAANEGETAEQLYRVAYPSGAVARVTDDLYDYMITGVARRANRMVTIPQEESAQIWTIPINRDGGARGAAVQITFEHNNRYGVAWTPDNRLVYGSIVDGQSDLWMMNQNGGDKRRLTDDAAFDVDPAVTSDGRFVVFSSRRGGLYNLWRLNLNDNSAQQLTSGIGEYYPHVSPDNRWIVYHRLNAGDPTVVWKVPLAGGAPVQLRTEATTRPAISPDNRLVVSTYLENPADARLLIGVYSLDEPKTVKTFKPLDGARLLVGLRFSPDSRAVVYAASKNGADNLYSQPLDGSPPRRLTDFTTDKIYAFDFEPNGEQVAVTRGRINAFVVLNEGVQ